MALTLKWSDFLNQPRQPAAAAVAVGVFDGLHAGHRALLCRLTRYKDRQPPVVFTFRRPPAAFLRPDFYPGDLMTLEQKLAGLVKLNIKTVVVIDFSDEFSKLSGEEFLTLIDKKLSVARLVIGEKQRFGRRAATGVPEAGAWLKKRAAGLDIVDEQKADGKPISSTRIRGCILAGRLKEAARLLEGAYFLDFRKKPLLSADCLNTSQSDQVCPVSGCYSAKALTGRGDWLPVKVRFDKTKFDWQPRPDVSVAGFILEDRFFRPGQGAGDRTF